MRNSVEYLCRKLNKYNSYDNTYKNKILDEFCSKLLDGNNVFSDSLNLFKNYKELSRKLKIKKEKMYRKEFSKVKIEFKVWQNQDMNLLSVYNLEYYLILEEFYQKNSVIEIGNWELERAEELMKEMETLNDESIKKIKNILEKTLKVTNRFFRKI